MSLSGFLVYARTAILFFIKSMQLFSQFNQSLELFLSGNSVTLLVAYIAGVVTFFASCLLPLVPTYLAYLSGVSLQSEKAEQERFYVFRIALAFVAGFVITFVFLGMSINRLGTPLVQWRPIIEKLAGLLFILLGLFTLGFFKNSFLIQERKPAWKLCFDKLFGKKQVSALQIWLDNHSYVHAFLVGIGFAFGWTPCIGPVLAVILYWASQAQSAWHGGFLLFVYGLGLGTPFLLVGLLFQKLLPLLKRSQKFGHLLMKIAGIIIIISGFLLVFGQFQAASMQFTEFFQLHISAA